MSDISQWSPESGSEHNNAPPPNGAPEGMAPSGVNDVIREIMAAVRRQWQQAEWFDYGHEITRTSGTSFNVVGDQTAIYTVGRRVRIRGVATGTRLGAITNSQYSVVTSVTITPENGTISNEPITVEVGINDPSTPSVPSGSVSGLSDELDGLETSLITAISNAKAEAISSAILSAAPPGSVQAFAMDRTPSGWLYCNGAAVSRTSYASLFSAIGTTYGNGNGSTTFNLPDMRGNFLRGHGGNSAGFGVVQGDAIRNITGTVYAHGIQDGASSSSGALSFSSSPNRRVSVSTGGSTSQTLSFNASTVVPTAGENRPRNIAMRFCIKY